MRPTTRFLPALAFALLLGHAGAAAADVITLRADEWCPYNCADTGDKPGYGVEIAKEIFARAGHTVDYRTVAWARALEDCRKGTVVAVIGTTRNESPDFVFPADPIGIADNTLAVKKGNPWRYDGPASLERVKLGVIQGYAYDGDVGTWVQDKAKDKARIDMIGGDNGLEQNLKKLLAGRIDATVDAKPVLIYKLAQLGLADKVELAGTTDPSEIHVAFSPANPKAREYAALFETGLAELRASGRLAAILAKYGIPDWK